jgi:hypothetical protein
MMMTYYALMVLGTMLYVHALFACAASFTPVVTRFPSARSLDDPPSEFRAKSMAV